MKKVLITIAVLLLIGAGYFTYEKWVKHSNLTTWSFVPADAALVIESELTQDLTYFQTFSAWQTLSKSSGFDNLNRGLSFLDSINGDGGFTAIFKDTPVLTSMHKVSSEGVDFLFIVELQNISQNTFASAAVGRMKEAGYRLKTRNYNDFKISEVSDGVRTLTYIFYKNFFLASFTPYLVEDAIRVISEDELPAFREKYAQLKETGAKGLTSFFINYENAGSVIEAFASLKTNFPLVAGNYEIMMDSSFIQLSGFSYAKNDWIATHTSQPATFEMAEIVPENTAWFLHITSSEMQSWKDKQITFLRSRFPSIKSYHDSLKSVYDFNADQVLDLVDNEIGIANLESPRARDKQKLMIMEVKDAQESLAFFEQLTQRIALARGDSVYSEPYSDNEIRFLPISNFPSTILGEAGYDFEQCFYINYRNYLIFSNDLQELKNLITSIQNEDTWGKSISMNNFLERSNNAANVSLFVNIPRAWKSILGNLKPGWSEHFAKNSTYYKSIEMAAFQYSYLDGRYFTNYTFTQPDKKPRNIPKTSAENGVRFISTITSKPFLVRTHAHKDFDIVLQDSTNTVYYLDPNQNALWSQNVEGVIKGSVYPIDYYKNGKIQHIFATENEVHIIDRTGTYIPDFPKKLPGNVKIEHINLIDYDLSRNYRIAITNTDGDVFLTDKDLKVLDGWSPRKLTRNALQPLSHARMGRTDVMISLHENGIINVMNRRGSHMKGFPFDTKQLLSKNYFLRSSNTLGNSALSVISKGGELTEINLEGDVIKRDQLIKTSADASFQLIPDTGGDSFIIIRKEGSSYQVLDDTGNLLFKKDYLSQWPILIQFYQFGAGKDLVIFTDTANKSLYIYDKTGNLVTGNPLNSEHEVSLIYSSAKKEFQVYTTWGSSLELYTFKY
ncbi:DUF3352 domain-containing protein [Ekhidna sp.]|uniref:DUF3352 domain-containing protein n=1 Tax=Ekhidna sp. TaxID=2608089 RepID=UPI00351495EE